jgi:Cyclic nucleotide-binding domain
VHYVLLYDAYFLQEKKNASLLWLIHRDTKQLAVLVDWPDWEMTNAVQGEGGYDFFIVKSGAVVCSAVQLPGQEPEVLDRLGPGSFFGEQALLPGCRRAASVHAEGRTVLLKVTRAVVEAHLGPVQTINDERQRWMQDMSTQVCCKCCCSSVPSVPKVLSISAFVLVCLWWVAIMTFRYQYLAQYSWSALSNRIYNSNRMHDWNYESCAKYWKLKQPNLQLKSDAWLKPWVLR